MRKILGIRGRDREPADPAAGDEASSLSLGWGAPFAPPAQRQGLTVGATRPPPYAPSALRAPPAARALAPACSPALQAQGCTLLPTPHRRSHPVSVEAPPEPLTPHSAFPHVPAPFLALVRAAPARVSRPTIKQSRPVSSGGVQAQTNLKKLQPGSPRRRSKVKAKEGEGAGGGKQTGGGPGENKLRTRSDNRRKPHKTRGYHNTNPT